jgi:pimeloyl-ACP methyl ester carboxylesterase
VGRINVHQGRGFIDETGSSFDRRDLLRGTGTEGAPFRQPKSSDVQPEPPENGPDRKAFRARPSFAAGGGITDARVISAGKVQFQYFECGNPDGAPLVLVHGFPDAPVAWQGVVAELEPSEFRIVLPYLRGCGETVVLQPEYVGAQAAALGHDLLAFTGALELESFHLVGHDWGAKSSYAATVLAPQRILTLTTLASPYLAWNGGLEPPAQVHGWWYQFFFQLDAAKAMLSEHRRDFCRELWRTWSPQWRFSEEQFASAAEAWDNPQFVDIVLDYYRMRWGGALGRRAYAELEEMLDVNPPPKIGVPTLFIQGSADACDLSEGADGQESCFSNGYERVILPGAGHFPHREDPGAVAHALLKQLRASGTADRK